MSTNFMNNERPEFCPVDFYKDRSLPKDPMTSEQSKEYSLIVMAKYILNLEQQGERLKQERNAAGMKVRQELLPKLMLAHAQIAVKDKALLHAQQILIDPVIDNALTNSPAAAQALVDESKRMRELIAIKNEALACNIRLIKRRASQSEEQWNWTLEHTIKAHSTNQPKKD